MVQKKIPSPKEARLIERAARGVALSLSRMSERFAPEDRVFLAAYVRAHTDEICGAAVADFLKGHTGDVAAEEFARIYREIFVGLVEAWDGEAIGYDGMSIPFDPKLAVN